MAGYFRDLIFYTSPHFSFAVSALRLQFFQFLVIVTISIGEAPNVIFGKFLVQDPIIIQSCIISFVSPIHKRYVAPKEKIVIAFQFLPNLIDLHYGIAVELQFIPGDALCKVEITGQEI